MTNLPTCGNCHSFSRDGKTMGIDVDGPANDKGLYALVPVHKVSTISTDYLIHWSAFSEDHAQKRFGFMSQVSPDGKFVVNSIDVPQMCIRDSQSPVPLRSIDLFVTSTHRKFGSDSA